MRCELIAVGTELLLGEVVDTNSAWLAGRLAAAGIDCHRHTVVGDNPERIAAAVTAALADSDAVVVCGGLGPTADDVTREALADALGAPLKRDDAMAASITGLFVARGRAMAPSNLRQADRPAGAAFIAQRLGTAPGLVCRAGAGVVYALPGVPHELREMTERAVVPDLVARRGSPAVIVSRTLRTWGLAESTLAEQVAPRLAALERSRVATIAFLAQGMEGIAVRVTTKAATAAQAAAVLDSEEAELRNLLGPVVFGTDEEAMEDAVAGHLEAAGLSLGVAESLTGGLVASRLVDVPGASAWFRGSVVAYDSRVKRAVLGVPDGPVVSAEAAAAMAEGAARVLDAEVGLSVTGVAGPAEQDGRPVGTVFAAVHVDGATDVAHWRVPGDRPRVRQYAAIGALDHLRRHLVGRSGR